MNRLDRNPWQGLTTVQIHDLENALREPQHALADVATGYEQIAITYAVRSATLLATNDLRGAMHNAELSVAIAAMAQRHRDAQARAAELIAKNEARALESPIAGRHRRRNAANYFAPTPVPSPSTLTTEPDDAANLRPGHAATPSLPNRLSHHVRQDR